MAALALHINHLPDDVLLRIFVDVLREAKTAWWDIGSITSAPRRDAALVCRRWAVLCSTAPVLASLTVHLGPTANFLPRVRSFCRWLVRHGAGKVQSLRLALGTYETWQLAGALPPPLSSNEERELSTLLAAALPACAGSLRQLDLSVRGFEDRPFCMGAWTAMLGGQLQRLVVDIFHARFSVSLEALSGLQQLELHNDAVLEPQFHLPPSLTRLRLVLDTVADDLPAQVTALTNLVELECRHNDAYSSDGYASLAALSDSLRRLTLHGVAAAPSCLPQLTALESLSLLSLNGSGTRPDELAPLRAALPHLRQLTHLECAMDHTFPDADDQAAFSTAPRLASLRYLPTSGDAVPLQGPWLRGLRCLSARLLDVAVSLPALTSAATQLQHLDTDFNREDDATMLIAVVDWAAHHTSLRQLTVMHDGIEPALQAKVLQAASRRPALSFCLGAY